MDTFKQKPFFSVIVCTFNRPEYLPRALDSIAAQTFKNFEVLVVNAGDMADAERISQTHELPIRYFQIPDQGVGMMRHFGLEQAEGEYAAYLDDDDEFLPNHLDIRQQILVDNPELGLLYNGFKTIGNPYVPDLLNPGKFLNVEDSVIYHAGTAVMNVKEALKAGGYAGIKHKYYPDNFFEVAKAHGMKSHRVKEKTYIYYRHPDSFTGRISVEYDKMA